MEKREGYLVFWKEMNHGSIKGSVIKKLFFTVGCQPLTNTYSCFHPLTLDLSKEKL